MKLYKIHIQGIKTPIATVSPDIMRNIRADAMAARKAVTVIERKIK